MKAEELYIEVLRVVEEVTGVPASSILTSNCEEHVDARHILVNVLCNYGFSDTRIAGMTKLTRPCICIIRNNFKYRIKRYLVNLYYEEVLHKIRSNDIVRVG